MSIKYLKWLHCDTQTRWWHDSAIPSEIDEALSRGALGVTTNPVLTRKTLDEHPEFWREEVSALNDSLKPEQRAEALLKIVALYAAGKMKRIYDETEGQHGYAFGQLNPALAGDSAGMLAQALRYAEWSENIAVKLPTTRAAIPVIEELAARSIAICTTLNFSVSQALAVGEAYKRGVSRSNGKTRKPCFVVQQGGRLEDYLRDVASDLELDIPENVIRRAGNALTKKSYALFQERGYEATIMPAGLRGAYHLTELAGARMVFSLHPRIQKMICDEDPPLVERIDEPVDRSAIEQLMKITEFKRVYGEGTLPETEFITLGVMQKTLSQFMETGWALLETYGTGKASARWT